MNLNRKLWPLFLVSMFAFSGSVWAMEVNDATTIGFQKIAGNVSRDDVRDIVSKNTRFEFWNKSDITLYIKLDNLESQTKDYIEVEPHARVISDDRVNYILFSQIKNPEFAEDSSLYVFDPDKKVYVRGKKEKDTYIVSAQTGHLPGVPGAGAILKLGRKALGEGARGKLGSETESGLSLRDSVGEQDILWLPNPLLPFKKYGNPMDIFSAIRDSYDNPDLVKYVVQKSVKTFPGIKNMESATVNQTISRGWTPLHEAYAWGYTKVSDLLKETYQASSIKDEDGIYPEQVENKYSRIVTPFLIEKVDSYIQKFKEKSEIFFTIINSILSNITEDKDFQFKEEDKERLDDLSYDLIALKSKIRKELTGRNDLKRKWNALNDEITKKKIAFSNNIKHFTLNVYKEVEDEFESGLINLKLDDIYRFLDMTHNGPNLSSNEMIKKIENLKNKIITELKLKKLEESQDDKLSNLRQIGYIMGYKDIYDLYLRGEKAFNNYMESNQNTNKLARELQDIMLDVF